MTLLSLRVGSRAGSDTEKGARGRMADYWAVVREPEGDESPHLGPFESREEAEEWAAEQERLGRKIHDIRKLDFPLNR